MQPNQQKPKVVATISKLIGGIHLRVDQLSGDSNASQLQFIDGVATLKYEDGDSGNAYLLRIQTTILYSETPTEIGTCHVRIEDLSNWLPVETSSGGFLAPPDFGHLMKAVREGMNLAIGLKKAEYPYQLQVRGHRIVLSCPIRSIEAVEVLPETLKLVGHG
jgi:hypothetical protein